MARYVAYYRVSTAAQGRSGLGLDAQRSCILDFLDASDEVVDEFVEVQSGRSDTREELWRAIAAAKRTTAKIVIAKLDRFSRKVSFIAGIMEQGVGLTVADMPNATDFQLHIFAALAQEERRLISERTRNALAEAKRRGVVLGRNGSVLAAQHRQLADERAQMLAPIIMPLVARGMSFSAIARHLNSLAISSARGKRFYAETVRNAVSRIRARSCR